MVEDRVTDGRRIAQLLASEFDGRSDGPLGRVAVVDADPDVEPAPEGTRAYDVAVDGSAVASVLVREEGACIMASADPETTTGVIGEADARGLGTERAPGWDNEGIVVPDGVAVKRAVDAVAAAIEAECPGT